MQTEYGLKIKAESPNLDRKQLDMRMEEEFENHRREAYETVLGVTVADKIEP